MKITDNDIKKSFDKMEIPEPSESARNKAVQMAMDEFEKKNALVEKKSKGFSGYLRHMGKTLLEIILMKGEPIMTQRQFATVGILVIAVGFIMTMGPQYFSSVKTTTESQTPKISKPVQPPVDTDKKQDMGERKGNEVAAPATHPTELRDVAEPELIQEEVAPVAAIELGQKKEVHRPIPQAVSPAQPYLTGKVKSSVTAERKAGRVMKNRAYLGEGDSYMPQPGYYKDVGRDKFTEIKTNSIKLVGDDPVSTFSIDVDTASYAFVRRQLNSGVLPQKDAVRVEELINYFDYDYSVPQDRSQPFKPSVAVYPTPWNENTKLLHIGIKGYDVVQEEKPRSNLVFLLDVSGSMNSPDKLPLLKNSFAMLVDTLAPEDTVAIAVYAGAAGTVLEPTKVKEKGKILASLDKLRAGGSTAGGAGIRLAYSLAEMNFDEKAVNRVILATDGDFNVGITNQNELKSYIENKRKTGIFLSVLGFGQGNYNDALMQTLAQNGNGNAAYIDSLNEARKVLVDEAGSTLFTIAKDVKIQIEFNPARVHDYRLIGYETRLLKREDFNNDKVDAGDVGSGHSVTAIYEITPVESREKLVDDLRYQHNKEAQKANISIPSSEYAFLKMRYKLPKEDTSKLITLPIGNELVVDSVSGTSNDIQFAAAVAAFGQVLRNDPFTGDFSYDDILEIAEPARGRDQFGYRSEFLNLVRLAKTAKGM